MPTEKQSKDSRISSSCTECYRRKQKCSKEWPCNHCVYRKVPHLCHFASKKSAPSNEESPNPDFLDANTTNLKRKRPDSDEEETPMLDALKVDPSWDGLKAWGYMPSHPNYKIGKVDSLKPQNSLDTSASDLSEEVEAVLHAMPPRSMTDMLTFQFLYKINYRYSAIYPPQFADQYSCWWRDRGTETPLSPDFTVLLFRVCAYTSQYLSAKQRQRLEYEMGSNVQVLGGKFHAAAEQLSRSFSPDDGKTSITRVQALFLKGVWEKGESFFVQSWHTLGAAIREAQELGFHDNKANEKNIEFECELRRRLWCLLYVWDWQMSAWLSRPHLIAEAGNSFIFPSLRLKDESATPDCCSPFAHITIQADLGRLIFKISKQNKDESPVKQIDAMENAINNWIDGLQPIFKLEGTDTSYDDEFPHIVFQRRQVHLTIQMTKLDPLRPYLAASGCNLLVNFDYYRELGIDSCLKVLQAARKLYDLECSISPKFHLVIFCTFDTATLLCSALIHDENKSIPKRQEIQEALDSALDVLQQFSLHTRIGVVSHTFLNTLIQGIPQLCRENSNPKAQKRRKKSKEVPPIGASTSASESPESNSNQTEQSNQDLQHLSTVADDSHFSLDQFRLEPGIEDSGLDMGGLEMIWDWDILNINTGIDASLDSF